MSADKTEAMVGRVLRRRVFRSFVVLEVVVITESPRVGEHPVHASVVLQAGSGESYALVRSNVRLGDVVSCSLSIQEGAPSTSPGKLRFDATHVEIFEKWDPRHGTLYYTKLPALDAGNGIMDAARQHHACSQRLPELILQCQDSFVNRLVAYIHTICEGSVLVQPSSTHFSNTCERHLLLYDCKFLHLLGSSLC